jgi:ribosomal protein S18 acetylase RimI-like enzyme
LHSDAGNLPVPQLNIGLREERASDQAFLFDLYASTREDELRVVPWSPAEKETFLRGQFHAQSIHYRTNYPGATFEIITVNGENAGRLYLWRGNTDLRIIDISIASQFRNQGIGTFLLKRILANAEVDGLSVSIHVERMNPALRLYERLKFRLDEDKGVYLLLKYTPNSL